eukprot:68194-Chlamydomonas_euryale.AAC.1
MLHAARLPPYAPLRSPSSVCPSPHSPHSTLHAAGITESLLGGSCGSLMPDVRHQMYIIRTSGARLLTLLNDIIDLNSLSQQTLTLSQED